MTIEQSDPFRHEAPKAPPHDIARDMLWEIEESLIAAEVEGRVQRSVVMELLEEHTTIERSLGNHAAQAMVVLDTSSIDRQEQVAA